MDRLADRLRALPPAPQGWVAAAAAIPPTRRALADLGRLARENPERLQQTAELERALTEAGYEASPALVEAVRRQLSLD